MTDEIEKSQKTIIGLEMLNSLNEEGCPACGKKFTLGEPVVFACGDWGKHKKIVHENEAIYDKKSGSYIEQSCYRATFQKS
ncbi:MAG: hypothetical protein MUP22_02720 [Desulfobacterales bacterium]|nr:hypothetical protein [Desulfobacterales bacterium]